jgi:uncharacterized protein YigE (DUF2233 family)
MKYVVGIGIVLLLVLWRATGEPAAPRVLPTPVPTSTPHVPSALPTISFEGKTFSFSFFPVPANSSLVLIPNFKDRKSFETITSTNGCTAAINGGFYQENNTPLGWFVAEGKTIAPPVSSTLFNAFLRITRDGAVTIEGEASSAYYGLQAGPRLLEDAEPRTLRIRNDEPARRSVVGTTSEGQTILLIIFSPEQVFEGPYLEDLPEIVTLISTKQALAIKDAMNLDGGSASAFYSEETRLGELTYVGSVLCAK